MSSCVILGAGFSFAAGLPLTSQLFLPEGVLPRSQSKAVARDHPQVGAAYSQWKRDNPHKGAEEWLAVLFRERENGLQEMLHGTSWEKALRFALSRLVDLPPGKNTHYYHGITTHRAHPTHAAFWQKVETELRAKVIVSLNYDLLVEQALHLGDGRHRSAPRCYYGGFMHTQSVRKMTHVAKREEDERFELVNLGHDFVLYKLHGSLNWAKERHSPTLKIHDDVRAVFRANDRIGVPAIVPPVPEKEMPPQFGQVWNEARKSLAGCTRWFVCGYSMPDYDHALRDFFAEVLTVAAPQEVLISAPERDWTLLEGRWRSIAPHSTRIRMLPGLPDALESSWALSTA